MKVWITKYALTTGIFTAEAEVCDTVADGSMIELLDEKYRYSKYLHGEGREWHRTEAGAIERAILMANKRTNSLKSSLAKNQELCRRLVQELEMVRKGLPKPPKPKKITKKQLAQLEKEAQEEDLADNYVQPYEEPGAH